MKTTICIAAAIAAMTTITAAGPLTPPPGAVSSTGKTTVEIEPRTAITQTTPGDADDSIIIDEPGSYYLAENITTERNKNGIRITVSNVTIDLNGFGVFGDRVSRDGIIADDGLESITIRNGRVAGFVGDGIDTEDSNLTKIEDVVSTFNGGAGFNLGIEATVINCLATDNTGNGFTLAGSGVITACVANNNETGIRTGGNARIGTCAVNQNSADGIRAGGSSRIDACTARSNGGAGVFASSLCAVTDSQASFNETSGFRLDFASTINDCSALANTGPGITVTNDCTVTNNSCEGNGNFGDAAGILITGGSNRIDGNTLIDNDRGIECTSTGSIIIRNILGGNILVFNTRQVAFAVAPGNFVGAVVTPAASGAVNDLSGASGIGTTQPYANIVY